MTTTSTHDEADVRRMFHDLLDHEPALHLEAGSAVRAGRRLRRRRQLTTGVLGLGVAGLATVGLVALVGNQADDGAVVTNDPSAPGGPDSPRQPAPEEEAQDEPLSLEGQELLGTIQASSPAGLTFDLYGPDESTPGGGTFLEGTVDDGAGPGRLSVYIIAEPGEQMLHPCDHPDFALGVGCNETVLVDGSILSVRDLAEVTDGSRMVDVMLTRPDGTGVSATSGNYTLMSPDEVQAAAEAAGEQVMPTTLGPDQEQEVPVTLGGPEVSRPDPVYTADQLSALVQAVYASTG